jgi:hypothetical protein
MVVGERTVDDGAGVPQVMLEIEAAIDVGRSEAHREYRKFKRPFPLAACAHPVSCHLAALPLAPPSSPLAPIPRPAGTIPRRASAATRED